MDEQTYLDMMDNASRWNGLLLRDRSERLPFYDAQTGITQTDCRHLWHKESERFPGHRVDQVFSYPAPRWKWIRKARAPPGVEVAITGNMADLPNDFEAFGGVMAGVRAPGIEPGRSNAVEWSQSEIDSFLQGEDDFPEPEEEEDDDYYDESYKKRRRRAGVSPSAGAPYASRRSGGRRQPTDEDAMKPFICDTCGLGYKTKPGLHYHLMKAHPTPAVVAPVVEFVRPRLPSNICDVCRVEVLHNAKTGRPEDLIVCADCGKAGHPTCLQFTDNMLISVKKYKWQCIDCKTCAVCGTSENDDVLLFCDDCDRGYHMYCLDPPISEPPEGAWSCRLCLAEFLENAASSQYALHAANRPASSSSQQVPDQVADHTSRSSNTDANSDQAAKTGTAVSSERSSSASQDQEKKEEVQPQQQQQPPPPSETPAS